MSDFPSSFEIDGCTISRESGGCYVIAEAGVSHFGDLNKAYDLIKMTVDAGVKVFKTQHFSTELLIGESSKEWRNRLKSKEMPNESIALMQKKCKEYGITFLCTAHDQKSLDFIDKELNVPAFKIGSGELENWDFIANIANRGKPIILSTGMYTIEQIKKAISVVKENGMPPLAIMHCVTLYPASPELINLQIIDEIKSFFSGPVGYSDHTEGTAIPLAAVALGANLVEKHITIEKNIPNAQDWKVACDPSNFSEFYQDIKSIQKSIGGGEKRISKTEKQSIKWARKSLHACVDIRKGECVQSAMVVSKRPGVGISPERINEIVGKKPIIDINKGELLDFKMFN